MTYQYVEKKKDKHGKNNPFYGKKHNPESIKKMIDAKKGKKRLPFSDEWKKKLSESLKGRIFSEEHKKKLGRSNEANHSWKGDNVKYFPLHKWVRRHLKQPEKCEICNKKDSYDLANITGIYNRDFKNWKYLCRTCHMKLDGRLDKLHSSNKKGESN